LPEHVDEIEIGDRHWIYKVSRVIREGEERERERERERKREREEKDKRKEKLDARCDEQST